MSIRLRLTLLYSAILALTLLLFGVVLYVTVSQVIYSVTRSDLTAQAGSIAVVRAGNLFEGFKLKLALPQTFTGAATYAQVRALDGTVADQTDNLRASKTTLPLPASIDTIEQQGAFGPSVVYVNKKPLLLYSKPIASHDGQVVGILQVARSLQEQDQELAALTRILLLGGGIATLLAFGAGWLLAGTALRPINRITRTAQEIGAAQDFDRRVDYGPPDEVGRLATTFNAMLARLGSAYQTQRRFVADASHELRTPLTSIRGNLGLLERVPPITDADRAAVLTDLVGETDRLSRLVADLLTLARADAGRAPRHEPVPVAPLVADLRRQATLLNPDRPVVYHGADGADGDAAPDVAVVGDRDALKQVLLILLDNALKFTPADGTITLTTAADDKSVRIAIHDTGPGIDPTVLPHIFERFYQGDAARAGEGTGLGLAIARALVEGQGGALTAESRPNQGSVFTVTLPRATAAGGAPSSSPRVAAEPAPASRTGS